MRAQKLPPKQPGEEFAIGFDFSRPLGDARIESLVKVAVIDDAGNPVSDMTDATKNEITEQIVYIWVRGGKDGTAYTISVTIQADDAGSSRYELEAKIGVVEIAP